MRPGPVVRIAFGDDFKFKPEMDRVAFVENWCASNLAPLLASLPDDLFHFFGEDFGRVSDLTVIAPITLGQDLLRRVPFLVELRNCPFEQQKQILFYIVDRLPRFVHGALDRTGNGAYLAEVAAQEYGEARISEIHLSDKWYAENLPPFKTAFEDAMMEVPADADVLSDLRALREIKGIPKLPAVKQKGKSGPRHGDAAIALALGHFASRMDVEEFGYHGVPSRPQKNDDPRKRLVRITANFRNHGGLL